MISPFFLEKTNKLFKIKVLAKISFVVWDIQPRKIFPLHKLHTI